MARRAFLLLCSLLMVPPVIALLTQQGVPLLLKVLTIAITVLTAAHRPAGLVALAGMLPLGTAMGRALGVPFGDAEVTELMVAAFLCGAGLSLALDRQVVTPSGRLLLPAVVFGAIVAASGAVLLFNSSGDAPETLSELWARFAGEYRIDARAFRPIHITTNWLQAIALAVVTERVLQVNPAIRGIALRTMVIGGTGAAAGAVMEWITRAGASSAPWSEAWRLFYTLRITPYFDFNATGSYYLLFAAPAFWWTLRGLRGWLLPSALFVPALWLTRSRNAFVIIAMTLSMTWLAATRQWARVVSAIVAAAIAFVILMVTNPGEVSASLSYAVDSRIELGRIGLRLSAENPLFGIGVGQFWRTSTRYITPELIARFPFTALGENAHNNFLQVLAELGIIGLAAFIWLLAAPAPAFVRSFRAGEASDEVVGIHLGVLAFVLSCVLQHPLLILQVLFGFFLALGVAAGLLPPRGSEVVGPARGFALRRTRQPPAKRPGTARLP